MENNQKPKKVLKTANRTKYLDDYKNTYYKKYNLIVKKTDVDVIQYLDKLPSKTQFIVKVVRDILNGNYSI